MYKKNLLIVVLTVFVIVALQISTFALPDGSLAENRVSSDSTYDASISKNSKNNYEYTVFIKGDEAISSEPLYIIKLFSFNLAYQGEEFDIVVWSKKDSGEYPQIILTDPVGKRIDEFDCSAIKAQYYELRNGSDCFFFKFSDSQCSVNDYTLISDAYTITDIQKYYGISRGQNLSENDDTKSEIITKTEPISGVITKDEPKEITVSEDEQGRSSKPIVVSLVILAAILLFVGVLVALRFINANKAKQNRGTVNTPQNKAEGLPKSRTQEIPFDASQIKRITPPIAEPITEIPLADIEPITLSYKSVDNKPQDAVKSNKSSSASEITVHNQIMSIYLGELPTDSYKGNVIPLYLSNVYDISLSRNAKPMFAVARDVHQASYLLIDNKYLYINYYIYNSGNFKTYSDIDGLEYCFAITSQRDAEVQYGQLISSIEPAVIRLDGNKYKLEEKGRITTV